MKQRLGQQLGIRCVALWCLAGVLTIVTADRARGQDETDAGLPSMAGMSGSQMVRGTVTAAAGDHISVKTDKGEAYQITVTSNTKVVKDRQPFRLVNLRPGDSVGAMGVLDAPAKTVHALFVMVVDPEELKKAREGLGKIYIAGKVTAIDELKLTILRPDNVTQVIAVDESTSFRRGGRQMMSALNGTGPVGDLPGSAGPGGAGGGPVESITLADIKVGDAVAGKGELKGGVFVPSQLAVSDPAARQRRRRANGGADAPNVTQPGGQPK